MKQEKYVTEDIESLNHDMLVDIKEKIERYIETYGESSTLSLSISYDNYIECAIEYKRLETDYEYEQRLKVTELQKQSRLKMYEKLKQEFEGE
jgi:hypothetical protein